MAASFARFASRCYIVRMPSNDVTISVRLPGPLAASLRARAADRGLAVSDLVRLGVTAALDADSPTGRACEVARCLGAIEVIQSIGRPGGLGGVAR
jgi:hypothetical protein